MIIENIEVLTPQEMTMYDSQGYIMSLSEPSYHDRPEDDINVRVVERYNTIKNARP
jgi:hypothetical protein